MVISDRQMGHPRACCSNWATHDAQNRWCPHGTNASRASRCSMRHTSHISCDGGALPGNLVLFLVDSSIPARQWTDICNTRCSILSRFSHFHVSHFPPLQHGAAFSCPAISCLAFSASSCSEVSATVLGVCGQYWLPGCHKVIDVIRGHPYCHLWKGQKRLRTTVLQWADADGSVFYSTLWTIKKCTLLIFNINFSNVD